MLFLAILLSGLGLLSIIGGGYVVVKRLGNVEQSLYVFQDFFSPKGDGQASPFVDFIGQTGCVIAGEVTDGVSKMLQGSIGGSMKGATSELEQQAIKDNPSLAILDGMPKSIKKNPLAMLAMQALINRNLPAGVGGGVISGGNGNNLDKPKFNL